MLFIFMYEIVNVMMFQVQDLQQSLKRQRKELNDCRAEITSLKMQIEGAQSRRRLISIDVEQAESLPLESYKERIEVLQEEIEQLKATKSVSSYSVEPLNNENEILQTKDTVVELYESNIIPSSVDVAPGSLASEESESVTIDTLDETSEIPKKVLEATLSSSANESSHLENSAKHNGEHPSDNNGLVLASDSLGGEPNSEKMVCSWHQLSGTHAFSEYFSIIFISQISFFIRVF